MNRRESFKAMNKNVIVLPKRDLNYKLKLVSNEDWEKRFEFFWALAWEKTQIRHHLPPFLSRNLCGSLLCSWPLFSLFSAALCISFSRCSSLDIRLFTYAFSFFSELLSPFLARFSWLAWRLLPLAFFGCSVSFFPAYFHSKPSLHKLEL